MGLHLFRGNLDKYKGRYGGNLTTLINNPLLHQDKREYVKPFQYTEVYKMRSLMKDMRFSYKWLHINYLINNFIRPYK